MSYLYSQMYLFHPLYGKVISLDKLMDDTINNDPFIYKDIKEFLEDRNLINNEIYDDFILLKNYTYIHAFNDSNKKLYLLISINSKYKEYCKIYKLGISLTENNITFDDINFLCVLDGKIDETTYYSYASNNTQQYTNNYIKIKTTKNIFYINPLTGYYRSYKNDNKYPLDDPIELTKPYSVAYDFAEGTTQFYYADDKYMMGSNKDQEYDVYLKYNYMDFVICVSYGLNKNNWLNLMNIKLINDALNDMGLITVNYRVIFLTDKNSETNNFQYNFNTEIFENNLLNSSEDIYTNDYTKVENALTYIYDNYLTSTNITDEFAEQHINEIYGYLYNHYNNYNTHIFYLGDPNTIPPYTDAGVSYNNLINSNGEFFYHITTNDTNNLAVFANSNEDDNCYATSNIDYESILIYEINKNRNKHLYYDEHRIRHGFYVYKNNDDMRETFLNLDYYFYLTDVVYNEIILQFNAFTHDGQTIQYRWIFGTNQTDVENNIGDLLDTITVNNFYIFKNENYNGNIYYKCIVKNNEYDIIYETPVNYVIFHNLDKIEWNFTKMDTLPSRLNGLEFDKFEINNLGLRIKKINDDSNIPYIKIDLQDLGIFPITNLELLLNIRFREYKDIQSIPKVYNGTTNDNYTNGETYYFDKTFYKYLVFEFYVNDELQCKTKDLIYENDEINNDWIGDDLRLTNTISNNKIRDNFILNKSIYNFIKIDFDKDLFDKDLNNTYYTQYNQFNNIRIKFKTTEVYSTINGIDYSNAIDFILEQFKMIYHIN